MTKPKRKRDSHVPATRTPDDDALLLDLPFEEGARDDLDTDLRHRMISEAAYHLYTQRGYADGYDMDDWLQAEEQVDHVLLNRRVDGSSIERG